MSDQMKPGAIPVRERMTFAEQWKEFEGNVVPDGAPDVQRDEMRKAFYCGAIAWHQMTTSNLDADSEPTQLDVDYMTVLYIEIETFVRNL